MQVHGVARQHEERPQKGRTLRWGNDELMIQAGSP